MDTFGEILFFIIALIIIVIYIIWKNSNKFDQNINEYSYQRYAKFYGNTLPKQTHFIN